jgi:hypothetical protein
MTFRDFAAAIMKGDADGAAAALRALLALDEAEAAAATAHFQRETAAQGPAFIGQAMGLRTAVASGDDAEIRRLLGACFAIEEPALTRAVSALRA